MPRVRLRWNILPALITIQAKHAKNDRTFTLELTLDGDQLKGTMTSGERTGQIVVKRVKP